MHWGWETVVYLYIECSCFCNHVLVLWLGGDPAAELVRHFLIETTSRGVRLKGCNNEPTFGECTCTRSAYCSNNASAAADTRKWTVTRFRKDCRLWHSSWAVDLIKRVFWIRLHYIKHLDYGKLSQPAGSPRCISEVVTVLCNDVI